MEQAKFNRWWVVVGAILIQLCLGAIYAWSLFTPDLKATDLAFAEKGNAVITAVMVKPGDQVEKDAVLMKYQIAGVEKEIKAKKKAIINKVLKTQGEQIAPKTKLVSLGYADAAGNIFNFTAKETQFIFSTGLFFFALVMIWAGFAQVKYGPKKLAMAGGIVLGIGYILAKFFGNSFYGQMIMIGIVGGAGIGLGYVVPIATGVKWFPDKKGLVTGLAVAGFGFGATIWVKLGDSWGVELIKHLGVLDLFMWYGIAFLVIVLIGSRWMVNPPAGYVPAGWTPPAPAAGAGVKVGDLTYNEMIKTSQFWMIWFIFVCGGMAGLMVIGNIKLFGIDALTSSLGAESASAAAGTAMAFYAIFNGLGRIVWGTVSDKIGRKISIFIMALTQGIFMLSLYFVGGSSTTIFIIYACLIGFNFGGNFALFPTACADLFGAKNLGTNYPFVFTAYGIGGIIGPMLGGYMKDAMGNYMWAFIPAGIACVVGSLVALAINFQVTAPKKA